MYKRASRGWGKHIDFILLDALMQQAAFVVGYMVRHGAGAVPYAASAYASLAPVLFIVDVAVAALFDTMHNVMKRGYWREFSQSFKHVAIVLAVMVSYLFLIQSGDLYSRTAIMLTAVLHLVLGYVSRLLWKKAVPIFGKTRQKASMLLVAEEAQVPAIVARLNPLDAFEFTGLVLSNRDAAGEEVAGLKVVANLAGAADYICREWVDEVFIYPAHLTDIEVHRSALYKSVEGFIDDTYATFAKSEYVAESDAEPESTVATVPALLEQCRQMAVPVHIRLPLSNIGGRSFIEKICGYNVLTTTATYASSTQLAAKRALDILGGLVGSVFALLIIAVVGPMIKRESPGPVLFKQTRIGRNGKRFQIYKIRSMYIDAEQRKAELMADNRVADGMMFKLDWDPRIIGNKVVDGKRTTGIGEFIRSYSLDEFPQFFNVLFGQMSLVGTRPPTEDEWERYKYHHRARLATRPGITGMWQVSGRSKITDFEEVVRLDTEYISHWNVGLDLRILLKTVKVVLHRDGAM